MSSSWGHAPAASFITTTHSTPNTPIDPSTVRLPSPFVVCIIGASRGIGAGIAYAYAQAGCSGLILASRRISGLEETAAGCKRINPDVEVEVVGCDITSPEDVEKLASRVRGRFGRLDVVAVNSGYSGPVVLKLTDTDPATFMQATNVNYVGTFLCAKYLVPLLLETENGAKAFIGVSSFASLIVRGPIANAQYCISKLAQLKLLEHLHEQYHSPSNLSVYAIHPGAVMSEQADETAPEEFRKYLTDSPDLCGAFCVWLTKGEGKKWLSGRLVSAKWDVGELEGRKEEVVEGDLLRTVLAV